jgi:hypothetical protein
MQIYLLLQFFRIVFLIVLSIFFIRFAIGLDCNLIGLAITAFLYYIIQGLL